MKNQQGLRGAHRLFGCQIGIILLMALIAAFFSGITAAKSAILGGLVAAIPSMLFATTLFRHQGARAARKIVKSFYKGEALKIFLSMMLFTIVFVGFKIVPLVFFIAYIVVQMSLWFAPLIFNHQQNRPESD